MESPSGMIFKVSPSCANIQVGKAKRSVRKIVNLILLVLRCDSGSASILASRAVSLLVQALLRMVTNTTRYDWRLSSFPVFMSQLH